MNYVLKLLDTPLLIFSTNPNDYNANCHIEDILTNNLKLLPIGLELSDENFTRWLKYRVLPRGHIFSEILLSHMGLSSNRPLEILMACKGLSLNDCYWIDNQSFSSSYNDINWFDSNFNSQLSHVALYGFGNVKNPNPLTCPELSLRGSLPKCFYRLNQSIFLVKYQCVPNNCLPLELFSEVCCSKVAQAMGVPAVDYTLIKGLHGDFCVRCKLFTTKSISYISASDFVHSNDIKKVYTKYTCLGPKFVTALDDMVIFDAIVCNTDRYSRNFGLLVDPISNSIIAPAPLFDFGNSLFSQAGRNFWESPTEMSTFINSQRPREYNDFFLEAKKIITPRHKLMLQKLIDFHIDDPSLAEKLPTQYLKIVEYEIRQRAAILLYN